MYEQTNFMFYTACNKGQTTTESKCPNKQLLHALLTINIHQNRVFPGAILVKVRGCYPEDVDIVPCYLLCLICSFGKVEVCLKSVA